MAIQYKIFILCDGPNCERALPGQFTNAPPSRMKFWRANGPCNGWKTERGYYYCPHCWAKLPHYK